MENKSIIGILLFLSVSFSYGQNNNALVLKKISTKRTVEFRTESGEQLHLKNPQVQRFENDEYLVSGTDAEGASYNIKKRNGHISGTVIYTDKNYGYVVSSDEKGNVIFTKEKGE
jgi:hypothetical protein